MNKELTKEEAEEFYNKLWLENKELIQENMNKLSMERFELELELVDKDKEIERLNELVKGLREERDYLFNKTTTESNYEIERLNNTIFNQNKRNSHQRIANDNLQNKNKELNNIINEFMEELKWQRKVSLSLNEAFAVSRIDTLINKLQELKEGDKE